MSRRAILVLVLLIAVAIGAIAKGSTTPLIADFLTVTGYGVNGDGQPYANSNADSIQADITSSQGLVVMTYNSGRGLYFNFDSAAPAWQAAKATAGLPSYFGAEIDLNGNNYYGTFAGMSVGSTAQLRTNLMFHWGGSTWSLEYPALAVMRSSANSWLVTSETADVPYAPFTVSADAALTVARRRSNTNFGNVNMPIHFTITLQ